MYRNKLLESDEMKTKTVHLIIDNFFTDNVWEDRHSKAVGELSASLAEEIGLNQEDVHYIRMAGQLHDIGKAAIRKEILKKTGVLTASERLEMRRHPEIGAHILKSTNQFAKVAEYVIAHHEQFDGRGYPKGLKGDNIPIQARILAITNAYDVMMNDCSYCKDLSKDQIIKELNSDAGKKFDPYLTNVFIEKVLN